MPKVGFIGLGNQGGPMAHQLIAAGHEVSLWARRPQTLAPFAASGKARCLTDAAQVGAAVDILLLCVVDDDDVLEVASAALPAMTPGAVLVIHSTSRPQTCRMIAEQAGAHGVRVIDAPVSGGAAAASAGTLCVMAGGDPATLERCRAVFSCYASTILHMGEIGAGQTAKLVNNVLMGANLRLAHEALEMGQDMGLDRDRFAQVLQASSGRSFALDILVLIGSPAAFAHGVRTKRKDLAILADVSASHGVSDAVLREPAEGFLRIAEAAMASGGAER